MASTEDLANLFLDVAKEYHIEGLENDLEELDARLVGVSSPSGSSGGDLADRLPSELADIPAKLAATKPESASFRSYFVLKEFDIRTSSFDDGALGSDESEAFQELVGQIQSGCARALSTWDEADRPALQRLAGVLHRGLGCVEALIRSAEQRSARSPQGTHTAGPFASLSEQCDGLQRAIEDVEKALEEMPAMGLDDLPGWPTIQRARSGIVEPHRHNIFLFKSAVLMVWADGEFSSVERDFLYLIAPRLHLSGSETHRLVEQCRGVSPSAFQGTHQEAHKFVQDLYLCALADGVVRESEKRMLRRLANTLGVSGKQVETILSGNWNAGGVDFLDAESVQNYLATRPDLPADTYLPEDMHQDRLEELRERLNIPPQEEILLAYENRFLAQLFECAAMTERHLCIRPAEGKCLRVELGQLEGVGSQIHSARVNLLDGRKIKLSRSSIGFLELLFTCLQENLRSI